MLQADLDALADLATVLDDEGTAIGELKPGTHLHSAATRMESSAVGRALARAGHPLDGAYHAMSNCLWRMAEATADSARNYENALDTLTRQLEAVGTDFQNTAA